MSPATRSSRDVATNEIWSTSDRMLCLPGRRLSRWDEAPVVPSSTGVHSAGSPRKIRRSAGEWTDRRNVGGCRQNHRMDSPAAVLDSLTDDAVLSSVAALGDEQRALDVRRVSLAGELAHRSREALGSEGMARRAGHSRVGSFLAELWGITTGEAIRLCDVGLATRCGSALDGGWLPPRYPSVGSALSACTLGVDAAAVIVRELESVGPRCSGESRLVAEKALVEHCGNFSVREVQSLARQVRDRLDEDGAEPRDELRRSRRALRIFTTPDGMVKLDWVMPPEIGGLVKAGIDAIVSEQLRQARESDGMSDDRILPQLRSDAAEQVFRHVATCDSPGGDLPAFTLVVRMALDSLLAGTGVAEIDGTGASISAATARRLAAESEFIPLVLGGGGEVLDIGRAKRLFTRAQKIALAERDGGCAVGGCSCPPSYAEAHHILWWNRGGESNLDNGVLLCSFHHHRVHDDGWQIEVREGIPYFIPPPWVDPSRRAKRGGRVRLDCLTTGRAGWHR